LLTWIAPSKKIKATMNARSQVFEIAVEARQVEEAVAR